MSDKGKKRKLADFIEVKLPGTSEPIRVVRGDVSEKVWAELQDQASNPPSKAKLEEGDEGRFTNADIMQLAADPASKPGLFDKSMQQMLGQFKDPMDRAAEIRAQLKARGFNVENSSLGGKSPAQGSPDEWKSMPKGESKSDGPGMSVRGQMLDIAKGATPKARGVAQPRPKMDFGEGLDIRPESERTRVMPEMDLRENPGTMTLPEVDGEALLTEENLKKAVKENEAEAMMKEGLDFTTPESRLAAAVNERNKQPPTEPEVTDDGTVIVEEQQPVVDATVEGMTRVRPVQRFGGTQLAPGVFLEQPPVDPGGIAPEEPGLLDRAAKFIGGLPEAAGRFIGGSDAPAPTLADPVDTGDVKGFAPPAAPGAPAPAPAVAGAPGGGSVSMGVKTRSGVPTPARGPDPVTAALAEQQALLNGAATLHADAEAKKTDIERQRLMQQKTLQEQQLKDTHALEEQRQAAAAAYSKTLTDGQAALADLTSQRRELLNQKVDPNRFWNEAGAGQKAMSILAGALFGWSGQGMQYMQHLQGLVDRDVKLQQEELKRRGGVLDDLVGDQRNIIALAKEKGMSDLAAVEAARVARYQELEDQLGILATDAGIQMQNPNLAVTLAGLAEKRAEHQRNFAAFMQTKANQDARLALDYAKFGQEEREMRLRGEGGGKGQQLKPQQTARLSEIFNSSRQMADMAKNYREKIATGLGSSMTGLTQYAPGGATDAAKWVQAMRGYAKSIGRGIEGGKMTDKDEDSILGSFIPAAGDTTGAAEAKMKRMAQYAADKYRSELQALGIGDYRAIGAPSPEQFQSFLEQQMGLTPAEPLPGETPR